MQIFQIERMIYTDNRRETEEDNTKNLMELMSSCPSNLDEEEDAGAGARGGAGGGCGLSA